MTAEAAEMEVAFPGLGSNIVTPSRLLCLKRPESHAPKIHSSFKFTRPEMPSFDFEYTRPNHGGSIIKSLPDADVTGGDAGTMLNNSSKHFQTPVKDANCSTTTETGLRASASSSSPVHGHCHTLNSPKSSPAFPEASTSGSTQKCKTLLPSARGLTPCQARNKAERCGEDFNAELPRSASCNGCDRLTAELTSRSKELNDVDEKMIIFAGQYKELQDKLDSSTREVSCLTEKDVKRVAVCKRLTESCDKLKIEIDTLQEQRKSMSCRQIELSKEREHIRFDIEEVKKANMHMLEQRACLQTQLDHQYHAKQIEIMTMLKRLLETSSCQNEKQVVHSQSNVLNQLIKSYIMDRQEDRLMHQALSRKLDSLRSLPSHDSEHESMETFLKAFGEDLDQKFQRSAIESEDRQNQKLRMTIEDVISKVISPPCECTVLRGRLKDTEEVQIILQENVHRSEQENISLRGELQSLQDLYRQKEERVEALEQRIRGSPEQKPPFLGKTISPVARKSTLEDETSPEKFEADRHQDEMEANELKSLRSPIRVSSQFLEKEKARDLQAHQVACQDVQDDKTKTIPWLKFNARDIDEVQHDASTRYPSPVKCLSRDKEVKQSLNIILKVPKLARHMDDEQHSDLARWKSNSAKPPSRNTFELTKASDAEHKTNVVKSPKTRVEWPGRKNKTKCGISLLRQSAKSWQEVQCAASDTNSAAGQPKKATHALHNSMGSHLCEPSSMTEARASIKRKLSFLDESRMALTERVESKNKKARTTKNILQTPDMSEVIKAPSSTSKSNSTAKKPENKTVEAVQDARIAPRSHHNLRRRVSGMSKR